ncbi:MAG: 4-hydroxy-tetrahydrodipicolinate reductase [Halodesulfurarchaeum sp.]
MRIGVTGATGRMGTAVIDAALARNDTISVAVNRDPGTDSVRGVQVESAEAFQRLLADRSPEVVIDFTGPASTLEYARVCADTGIPLVVGTTGFDPAQLATLQETAQEIPVLLGANFARGVQALLGAIESALEVVPGYDAEVTETHHNEKRDAPSGTAGVLVERIESARETNSERVYGRAGESPRSSTEIGIHARRAGDVTGEHEVLLAGNEETLQLTHRVGSRQVFAEGALDAASWLADQSAGFYRFADVADRIEGGSDNR